MRNYGTQYLSIFVAYEAATLKRLCLGRLKLSLVPSIPMRRFNLMQTNPTNPLPQATHPPMIMFLVSASGRSTIHHACSVGMPFLVVGIVAHRQVTTHNEPPLNMPSQYPSRTPCQSNRLDPNSGSQATPFGTPPFQTSPPPILVSGA